MKQENSNTVKIFLNKFENTDNEFWNQVELRLKKKGYDVYKETSKCDVALLMNASFLNPTTYKNKYGFYLSIPSNLKEKKIYWMNLMGPILEKYYEPGHLMNFFGLNADMAADKIISLYKVLKDDNASN